MRVYELPEINYELVVGFDGRKVHRLEAPKEPTGAATKPADGNRNGPAPLAAANDYAMCISYSEKSERL
jgi:hypothetical protein